MPAKRAETFGSDSQIWHNVCSQSQAGVTKKKAQGRKPTASELLLTPMTYFFRLLNKSRTMASATLPICALTQEVCYRELRIEKMSRICDVTQNDKDRTV